MNNENQISLEQNPEPPKNFWQRLKLWQKIGALIILVILLGLLTYFLIIPRLFCTITDFDIFNNPNYVSCGKNSDCVVKDCNCLNDKGASKFDVLRFFCPNRIRMDCIPASGCECKESKCVDLYSYSDEEGGKFIELDKIRAVFNTYLSAEKNCDINLADSLITEKSKEIMHYTCSNMADERKCLANKTYKVLTKGDTAIIHFDDFSHKTGWPFFFAKENGEWKIDFYKMANGITMGGSGCDTGWGWRNEEIKKEFCSYFKEGECPEEIGTSSLQNSDISCNTNNDCTPRFSHCDCRFHCINKTVKYKDCANVCSIFPEAPVCYCINNKCKDSVTLYSESCDKLENAIALTQNYIRNNNIAVLDINNPYETIAYDDYWHISFETKPEPVLLPPYRFINVEKKTCRTYEVLRE